MKKIMAQALKEFSLFRRDKLLILLAVLMPIVLMLLAGVTGSLRLRNVSLLVYNYENSALSRAYLETYGAALTFRMVPSRSAESPERALASWRGRAVLIIPQNFERHFRRGATPAVQLMIDATDSNAATALGNYAESLNSAFARQNSITAPPARGVNLQRRLWYNPGLSERIYFGTGGLGLMLIIFPALLGALTTAKEYETGTSRRQHRANCPGLPEYGFAGLQLRHNHERRYSGWRSSTSGCPGERHIRPHRLEFLKYSRPTSTIRASWPRGTTSPAS